MLRRLTDQQLYDIGNTYTFGSNIFNLTLGLMSNLLIIFVLTTSRKFRENQCAFYLIVESISNMGLFLTNAPSGIVSYELNEDVTYVSEAWCKIKTAMSNVFGGFSIFTICFSAFDQYLSTNHRYSLRQMSTLKLAHRFTIFNVCFFGLHSILHLIFEEVHPTFGCFVYNPILKQYLSYFFIPIMTSAIPSVTTIAFSVLAYRNVHHIVRRQIPIVRRRLDQQLTAMVLTRAICLIILCLPYTIFSLYQLNVTSAADTPLKTPIGYIIILIIYSLIYANFSINFYLFLLISSRFRRQVKHCLVKYFGRLLKCLRKCKTRLTITNRNQIAPEMGQPEISSAISS